MTLPIILLIALALVLLYGVGVYNSLVSLRTRIQASIQEIGNQLKRQADLIPNLEASVKGYLAHEKDILKMLSDARKLVAAGKDASDKVSDASFPAATNLRASDNIFKISFSWAK